VFGAIIRLCSRGLSLTIAPWIFDSFNHSFPPDPSDEDAALCSVFRGILGENKRPLAPVDPDRKIRYILTKIAPFFGRKLSPVRDRGCG
jgi:hypothetical protein